MEQGSANSEADSKHSEINKGDKMPESLEEFREKVEASKEKESSPPTTERAPEPIKAEQPRESAPEPTPEPKPKSTYESLKERAGSAISSTRSRISGAATRVKQFISKEKKEERKGAYQPIREQQARIKETEQKLTAAKNKEIVRKAADAAIKAAKIKGAEVREKLYKAGKTAGTAVRESSAYKGAQLGYQESKEKLKSVVREGMYATGREIGRAPITAAKYGVQKVQEFQTNVRTASQKGWHAGILQRPGSRISSKTYGKLSGRPIPSFYPHTTTGRQPRIKIPRGIIKTYWSKKLKKLARSNIKRFGQEEGLARTRQVAELSGWKMQ